MCSVIMRFDTAASGKGEYVQLPGSEAFDEAVEGSHSAVCPACAHLRGRRPPFFIAGAFVVIFLVGLALGRYWASPSTNFWSLLPASETVQFTYNRTYALAPSEDSNRAWSSLTPAGRGFVRGDTEGSVYGLTVFHQLHCLDMIRHGYYAAQPNDQAPAQHRDAAIGLAPHGRHCFDYLRQTIQCAADTNLEPVNFTLGGVNGWTEHVCRDFAVVQRKALERRAPDRQ